MREVLILLAVVGLLIALLSPNILAMRESARIQQCEQNMKRLGTALYSYHDTHRCLPPAAIWGTQDMHSLALNASKQLDIFTRANWVLLLLPHLDKTELANSFDYNLPVAHEQNLQVRNSPLSLMRCPSDTYNSSENMHQFASADDSTIHFARGNYAINGGTHTGKIGYGSTASPSGDYSHLLIDQDSRKFQYWGNGVAGFNKTFSFGDLYNGRATLVALEEIRAGIHPIDPRGVWSWGHIGSSVTWAHGVNGDDYGPNNPWARSDDFIGCGKLHDILGVEKLVEEKMACVSYVDVNTQATSRSQHDGGVNVLFLDGTVKFISDKIDPGVWHVIHSRETPADILASDFDEHLNTVNELEDASEVNHASISEKPEQAPSDFLNSTDMKFVLIPKGSFIMGLPDDGNDYDLPPESPQHTVQITHPFYLGAYEVTQGDYEKIMGINPAFHQSTSEDTTSFPVEQVTWNDANEFCRRLSNTPTEKNAKRTYRLPTEAEWEYACRAGSEQPYAFSSVKSMDDTSGEAAGKTHPLPITKVGSYAPNAFGLYDMRGNVWEWCSDWFDRDYYSRSPLRDPQGPKHGYLKVVRGCDWIYVGEGCKINYPITVPWKHNPFIGFRIVCEMRRE
ncbi:SUMF1/EgtB/PvdO family nonheme iron enzyme [Gimesia benthica]|uniref:SUMF1/EgtB/PvdO family nonheme iron enzyme n=1 Tax=Gimesia benthica TaxID=2608982 RepID=UPI001885912C|nr:SUMF1/EgtB/PvdO family nonheme iron enzyme [Gimesia benthica]